MMTIDNTRNTKTPAYNLYLDPETQLHVSDGNGKMGKGVYNISLLPGSGYLHFKGTGKFCKGKMLTNIKADVLRKMADEIKANHDDIIIVLAGLRR